MTGGRPRLSLTVQYAANAAQGLYESGVTSIRTAGTPHFIDVALKRAYATGRLAGPRIFAGGWFLTTTAGHALGTGFARTCDGPTGFVRAIREPAAFQAIVEKAKAALPA